MLMTEAYSIELGLERPTNRTVTPQGQETSTGVLSPLARQQFGAVCETDGIAFEEQDASHWFSSSGAVLKREGLES